MSIKIYSIELDGNKEVRCPIEAEEKCTSPYICIMILHWREYLPVEPTYVCEEGGNTKIRPTEDAKRNKLTIKNK